MISCGDAPKTESTEHSEETVTNETPLETLNYSSVDIIIPPIDNAGNYLYQGGPYTPQDFDWRYQSSPKTAFYSQVVSGAERLPNGNTLVCEGVGGHFFEIDDKIKIISIPRLEKDIEIKKFYNCLDLIVIPSRIESFGQTASEAMACGTPSIYSACCAQMEFAKGKGLPVKVLGERPALDANYNHFNTVVGNYYEPDFEDLARVMRDAFENYTDHKKRAIYEAKLIHRDFNWDRIAEIGRDTLEDFMAQYAPLEYGSISDGFKNNIDFEFINADQYCPFFDIEEGDVVLDLGASFGPFIWKAKKNNPSKIYAVEPLSIYHPVIEKNAKGANYELIKKALTGYNGTLDLEWDIHMM